MSLLTVFINLPAHAALYNVYAQTNSSNGGVGRSTISLISGELFTVTVDPKDLWSAGTLPRWSNADGLIGNLYATGSDESGQPKGTRIGMNWGTRTQWNLTAPYGTLVGEIGSSGTFFKIGTNYSGIASYSGILNLFYWDLNGYDNTGMITAFVNPGKIPVAVNPVPIPAAIWLFGTSMLGILGIRRKISY